MVRRRLAGIRDATKRSTTRGRWAAGHGDTPFAVSSGGKQHKHHEKTNAAMQKCGLSSFSCKKFDEARTFLAKQKFSIVLCHDTLPDGDFRDVVAAVKPTPVVVLSRFAEWAITSPLSALELSITSPARQILPKPSASCGQP
jgi:hypothetical protein